MNKETFIKIVRLKGGGEDIIGEIDIDRKTGVVSITNPMHIIFKRLMTGQTVMMMMPWLPVELLTHNEATIDSEEILTFMEPKPQLVTYYVKLSIEALEKMNEHREFDDSLMDELDEEDADLYTLDESDFEESFPTTEEESDGKPTLH